MARIMSLLSNRLSHLNIKYPFFVYNSLFFLYITPYFTLIICLFPLINHITFYIIGHSTQYIVLCENITHGTRKFIWNQSSLFESTQDKQKRQNQEHKLENQTKSNLWRKWLKWHKLRTEIWLLSQCLHI